MLAETIERAQRQNGGRASVATLRTARKVAQFIAEWELAVRAAGRTISAEDFARHWHDGAATVYRRLAEFRQLYPEAPYPHDLMGPLVQQIRRDKWAHDPVVRRDAAVVGLSVDELLAVKGYDPTVRDAPSTP
jgi:hypothetical protein